VPNAVLLDHSTLNSIARLLENTSSRNKGPRSEDGFYSYIYDYSTTIDVASLGAFVEALLAHEKVYYVRIGGQEYRWEACLLGRSAALSGILEPIHVDPELFRSVNEQSAREIQSWQEKGGLEELGDALLRMLGGVFDPRAFNPSPWADVAYSLRDAEESDWFGEFVAGAQSLFTRLFAHLNEVHCLRSSEYFESFVRLVFTLCYRASMYKWLAFSLGLPYAPYIVRAPLVLNSLLASPSVVPVETAKLATKYVERLRQHALEPLEELMGTKLYTFTFPVFLPYLAARCGTGRDIVEAAVEMRSNAAAKAFREWVGAMNARMTRQGLGAGRALVMEIERWSRSTREQLGLSGRTVVCAMSPSMESLAVPVPGASGQRTDESGMQHLVFLQEVADSVVAVDDAKVWRAFGLARSALRSDDFDCSRRRLS
jgi:hypothetical protein